MHHERLIRAAAAYLALSAATVFGADYADEARDYGVSSMSSPKGSPYSQATPMSIPGAKTIKTDELKEMLAGDIKPVLVDALAGAAMIDGADGLGSSIGEQRMFGPDRTMFPKALEKLTGGDKGKAVVFYCRSSQCWHSYNASLHAIAAGYTNVYWYRGGIDAWIASGGKTVPYSVSAAAR